MQPLASSTALPAGKPAGETVPCRIWWMSLGGMVRLGVARWGWGVACGFSGGQQSVWCVFKGRKGLGTVRGGWGQLASQG
jgi:hypothetical protein